MIQYQLCLTGIILAFCFQLKVSVAQTDCQLCLLLCGRAAHGMNIPFDQNPMEEEMDRYPPRGVSKYRDENECNSNAVLIQKSEPGCPYTKDDGRNLLKAIEKIVFSFYETHYEKLNVRSDGGVGLGVLKGQLNYILEKKAEVLPNKLLQSLKKLHGTAGVLGLQILDQSIKAKTDDSYRKGAEVLRNHTTLLSARYKDWEKFDTITKHFSEFKKIGQEKDVVYPYLDFHCLVALVRNCDVPHVCQKMYLTDIYSQYMLMHQVIYQQFAEKRSCVASNPDPFPVDLDHYRHRLCSKAYLEAEFLQSKEFPTRFIDLFAEQVGFCGLAGFPNFMRADWLREILSWQDGFKSGCFPDLYGELKTTDATIVVDVKTGEETSEESCLVHLTSVSLMALSVNLRYMVDACSSDISNWFH